MKQTVTIDIGTTRVKLACFNQQGERLASVTRPTPTFADKWGPVYDIDMLKTIVVSFIQCLEDEHRRAIERIAIAGVGESGGLVGPDLQQYSPMIVWYDNRGSALIEGLSADERVRIYNVTGLPANANYALSKIRWAMDNVRSLPHDLKWLNVSEFLAAYMTGVRRAEYSLASRTMALDLRAAAWAPEICEIMGVDAALLPDLMPATQGVPVSQAFAREAGLSANAEVHVAGHDHMVGSVGAGLGLGELLNSTGTTEGLLMLREEPSLDATSTGRSSLANGIACDGKLYTLFASIPTGGSVFMTLQRMLAMTESSLQRCLTRLDQAYISDEVDITSMPIVVPHFRGSPPPEKNAKARAVMANLDSEVSANDIVFGCFLGLAVQFSNVLSLFEQQPTVIKVIGPASQNNLWLHLKADLLGTNLSVSKFSEVVSRGAQALASGETCGWAGCSPRTIEWDERRHQVLNEWLSSARSELSKLGALAW